MVELDYMKEAQREVFIQEFLFYHQMVEFDLPLSKGTFQYRVQKRIFKRLNFKWFNHHVTVTQNKLKTIPEEF